MCKLCKISKSPNLRLEPSDLIGKKFRCIKISEGGAGAYLDNEFEVIPWNFITRTASGICFNGDSSNCMYDFNELDIFYSEDRLHAKATYGPSSWYLLKEVIS
jgi:hypothetical protein